MHVIFSRDDDDNDNNGDENTDPGNPAYEDPRVGEGSGEQEEGVL